MKQLILILTISLIGSSASLTFAQHTLPASHGLQGEAGSVNGTLATIPDTWANEESYIPLTLHNSVVFWPGSPPSCSPTLELAEPCQISSRTANGAPSMSTARLLHNAGNTGPFIKSNLAVDDTHVYWIGNDFQIKRLPRSATTTTTPEVIGSTTYTTSTLNFEIDVDANYIFWIESNTASPISGRLFRMPKSGGAVQLMAERTISGFGAGYFEKLRADGSGGAYYVSTFFGSLFRTVPDGADFTSTFLGITGVASYALSSSHIYWAERLAKLVIKRAPRSNPSAVETLANRGNTGNPTAPVIAVDNLNVYWQEVRGYTGPIFRLALSGGTPEQITDNYNGALSLASNDRYLFWNIGGDGTMYRLPVNASTWTLDLEVTGLEVVQTVQNPNNDVPLVSGKETFVRVFPRILSSSPSRATVDLWPNVLLYGTRGGTPLPESPLEPVYYVGNARSVGSTIDRRDINSGVWFRLPASWTDGTVQLRAVANPRRVQAETSYANNEVARTVSFVRKAPICLDIKPVSTERGVTISSWPSNEEARRFIQSFFIRAEQLLPTHELRVFMRGGDPLRKPRWYLFESDPFGLSRSNADSGWMLFLLKLNTLFDSNLCSDGGRTLRVVMAQDFPDREVNGMNLEDTVLFFTFWTANGNFAQNVPGGGVTLAHEIGHAYGRGHINCPVGVPNGVDSGYPHPTCQIGTSGLNEFLGFDSGLSRRFDQPPSLLFPETTGDLMSYAHFMPQPRWTSNYTWQGIFNQISNRSLAVADSGEDVSIAQSTVSFIVTGFISGTVAEMRESFQLPEPLLSQVTAQINASTVESPNYRIRALNGTTLLADRPLRVAEANGDLAPGTSEPELIGFFQRLDLPQRPTRIEIVQIGGGSIGGLNVSSNPPTVSITAPTAGSTVNRTLTVSWNASDPDGGILHHMVRYSADNGATWTVIAQGLTASTLNVDIASLPGGTAHVQVITTDGLNTAIATSEAFSVARRTPEVSILLEGGPVFAPGDAITLRSRAYDPEDGFLSGSRLQWQITGPLSITGDGEQLTLLNLPPGLYTARLQATDSDSSNGEDTIQFSVSPKRISDDSTAPVVDGFCEDAAYNADPHPVSLRYNEGTPSATVAQVRFVRVGAYLYACFNGLPVSTSATEAAILKFDLNNSADARQQADDLIVLIQRDGVVRSGRGNGSVNDVFDPILQSATGAVSTGTTSWSAEMQIAVDRFGGWDRFVRMLVAHDTRSAWPRGSVAYEPQRWGVTMLGEVNYRVNLPLVVK